MQNNFTTITEIPGGGATLEQLSMARTRYELVANLGENKDVLEVACGSGYGLGYIAQKANCVVGGDIDSTLVSIAKKNYLNKINIHQISAEKLPFGDESFDVVALLEAIYYVHDVSSFINEAHRVLKPNGKIIVCFPNCEWKNFNPSPFSVKYFTASEFEKKLNKHQFSAETFYGFRYEVNSLKDKLFDFTRSFAVKLKLIPKSFALKDKIKRIFFGKLITIPTILTENHGNIEPLVTVVDKNESVNYRVIYSIGTKK